VSTIAIERAMAATLRRLLADRLTGHAALYPASGQRTLLPYPSSSVDHPCPSVAKAAFFTRMYADNDRISADVKTVFLVSALR
jgi:hypothetical protein